MTINHDVRLDNLNLKRKPSGTYMNIIRDLLNSEHEDTQIHLDTEHDARNAYMTFNGHIWRKKLPLMVRKRGLDIYLIKK